MALSASTILSRAAKTLLDELGVEWSAAELLDYLNATLRFICLLKPDAYVLNEAVSVVPGNTQTIPENGYQLLRAICNVIDDEDGRAITKIEANHLNRIDPDWPTHVGEVVKHFMFDPRNPTTYSIYPAIDFDEVSSPMIRIEYVATPDSITSGQNITIKPIYETPLYWGILAFAYTKNAKRGDIVKENKYISLIAEVLGNKSKVQAFFDSIPAEIDSNEVQ